MAQMREALANTVQRIHAGDAFVDGVRDELHAMQVCSILGCLCV